MEESSKKLLRLSSSTHIVNSVDSTALMRNVLIALAPASALGIALYGFRALALVLVCVISAELAEAGFRLAVKREPRYKDLSAAVTGLLLALTLPPALPLWMATLGAVFAIVVAKEFFGGLGANVFNPALAGRAFLLTSFPAAMTSWTAPFAPDAASTATPLAYGAANLAARTGAQLSLNDAFLGFYAGTLGETSALCIIAGGIFLGISKTIDLRAVLSMLISAAALAVFFGLNPLLSLLTGGLLFGAVFMATDYTSAPVTEGGKIIFGLGCGVITMLIRKFGAYPEGVMYSILIMNALSPFLNKILHKKYGFVKKTQKKQQKEGTK